MRLEPCVRFVGDGGVDSTNARTRIGVNDEDGGSGDSFKQTASDERVSGGVSEGAGRVSEFI